MPNYPLGSTHVTRVQQQAQFEFVSSHIMLLWGPKKATVLES